MDGVRLEGATQCWGGACRHENTARGVRAAALAAAGAIFLVSRVARRSGVAHRVMRRAGPMVRCLRKCRVFRHHAGTWMFRRFVGCRCGGKAGKKATNQLARDYEQQNDSSEAATHHRKVTTTLRPCKA